MRIKEIREAKGQKQKDLANALGIAANTLSQYECGKREPDLETTKRIAEFLGVSIDYLLGTEQKEMPATTEDDGQMENVVIYHRDGKTVVKKFSPEKLALVDKMLSAIEDDDNPRL